MTELRPTVRVLSVALLALLLGGGGSLAQEQTEVVFSPHQGQDIAISKALLEAQECIYMALYSISSESDWVDEPAGGAPAHEVERWQAFRERLERGEVKPFDMIKHKAAQGVKCRLVLHRAALDPWAIDTAKAYQDAGVEVRWTHKTMHNKFCVIDKHTLINGSGNWSRGAAERYSENTMIFRDQPALAQQFLREFYYLWYTLLEKGRAEEFDRELLPVPEPDPKHFVERHVTHQPWRAVEAYFTSENGSTQEYTCADRIISEMRRARKQLWIMINHFNMGRISWALTRLHRERNQNADPTDDLEIKVLMDLGEYDASSTGVSRAKELEQAGIEVRYKTYSLSFYYQRAQFMHHKVMIVDSERLVTGSYNWSSTAEFKNYENITVHQGPTQQTLIDAVEGEFQQLWELRRDLFPDFKRAVLSQPGDPGYRRWVPVHFSRGHPYFHTPMTLSRAELESFREHLEQLGYRPALEGDQEAMDNHNLAYFDKETGTFTNQPPTDATFVEDEDTVRTPVTNTTGLVGGVAETVTPVTPVEPAPEPTPE